MSEKNKTAIDAAFEEFEKDCVEGKIIRREMIENLRSVLSSKEMLPSPYDKAMMVQAKVSVFKTLDDLLKSDEDVSVKKLKMKLARKDTETNGMVGKTIVELLKNIRSTGETNPSNNESVDRNAAMEELKKVQAENQKDLTISQGETEACGSSPTTDGNAAEAKEMASKKEEDDDE